MSRWGLPATAASLLLAAALEGGGAGVRFRDVAAETGLRFTHENGAAGQYYLPEIMGSGGAFVDYDGDGDLDVVLVQGGPLEGGAATVPGPRLFRNDLTAAGATLRFTDVTDRSGFVAGDIGMGVAAGDYDNDGHPDLYFTNLGSNRLYRNTGRGGFAEVTRAAGAGLDEPRWSTSASFSDYDADGHLDLYVANYVDYAVADGKTCTDPTGRRDYCGPLQFRAARDRLFRNAGTGTFVDVSDEAGLSAAAAGAGLGVSGADFNGDGRLDFYVANDAGANHLWMGGGAGRFEDGALLAGLAFDADGQPEGSMGIAAGDADNDGDVDIFVTNITGESHAYYENRGGGLFEDRRLETGIGAATRPFTGFGAEWLDADHDRLPDLVIVNGAVTILEALRGDPLPFRQPNQLLLGGGGRFRDVAAEAGRGFEPVETSRGAAVGDVDNDGDLDVLITNNAGPVRLLLNESPKAGAWLQVRLEGAADNRQALGARVRVTTSDGASLWRRVHTDGSYLSSSDPRVHVGLGDARGAVDLLVDWPRGGTEVWKGLPLNRSATLKQGTGNK